MEQTEVREQILDTARDLFQKQGFGKTSMDDIARHLGRAKSGIYYYFKSKHAILEELVRREIERMEEEVEVDHKAGRDPRSGPLEDEMRRL